MSDTSAVKLTKALEPFARAAAYFDDDERRRAGLSPVPDNVVGGYAGLLVGDFRRARALLDALKEEGEGR